MNLFAKRFQTTVLYRCDFTSHLATSDGTREIVIRKLDPGEVGKLAEVNEDVLVPLEISKFEAGLQCYVAELNNRLAHYSWVQESGKHILDGTGRTRLVRDGHLWVHACFTAVRARGRRIYPMVPSQILDEYSARGFTTAWIYALESNAASRKGICHVGFKIDSRLRSVLFREFTIPLP